MTTFTRPHPSFLTRALTSCCAALVLCGGCAGKQPKAPHEEDPSHNSAGVTMVELVDRGEREKQALAQVLAVCKKGFKSVLIEKRNKDFQPMQTPGHEALYEAVVICLRHHGEYSTNFMVFEEPMTKREFATKDYLRDGFTITFGSTLSQARERMEMGKAYIQLMREKQRKGAPVPEPVR